MLIRFLIVESPETFMYLIIGSFRKYSGLFITTGNISFRSLAIIGDSVTLDH